MTGNERLARAVLLFFRGGPWTDDDRAVWETMTGYPTPTDALRIRPRGAVRRTDAKPGPSAPASITEGAAMTERIATTEARLEGFYWVVTRSEPAGDRLLGARRVGGSRAMRSRGSRRR